MNNVFVIHEPLNLIHLKTLHAVPATSQISAVYNLTNVDLQAYKLPVEKVQFYIVD